MLEKELQLQAIDGVFVTEYLKEYNPNPVYSHRSEIADRHLIVIDGANQVFVLKQNGHQTIGEAYTYGKGTWKALPTYEIVAEGCSNGEALGIEPLPHIFHGEKLSLTPQYFSARGFRRKPTISTEAVINIFEVVGSLEKKGNIHEWARQHLMKR